MSSEQSAHVQNLAADFHGSTRIKTLPKITRHQNAMSFRTALAVRNLLFLASRENSTREADSSDLKVFGMTGVHVICVDP
jgi:hypothetical protein